MQQDDALPAHQYPHTAEGRTTIKSHEVKTGNEGRPAITPNDLLKQTLELLRMALHLLNVCFVPLHGQVLHFLKKHPTLFI
jgi:hypothetical protein